MTRTFAALAALFMAVTAMAQTVVLGKLAWLHAPASIYKTADKTSPILYTAKAGEPMVVKDGPSAEWYRVLLQNGEYGYVPSEGVEVTARKVTRTDFTKLSSVTAERLTALYSENEIAADQQYLDKTVKVVGVVDRVGRSSLGLPTVTLRGKTLRGVVFEFLPTETEALSKLRAGQKVTIAAKIKGAVIGGVTAEAVKLLRVK